MVVFSPEEASLPAESGDASVELNLPNFGFFGLVPFRVLYFYRIGEPRLPLKNSEPLRRVSLTSFSAANVAYSVSFFLRRSSIC